MNLIEKILARASGRSAVAPGDIVVAEVDCALLHDLSARSCREVFEKRVGGPMAHPERIITVFDHQFSPPAEDKATILRANREFCYRHGMPLYDCGSGNIHNVAVQNGHIKPGALVVGSDSHSPVQGVMGCFCAALGNDSYAATVMPFSKAWFRVPETIRVELTGATKRGTTARDVALWLCAMIGEGKRNYQAIKFCGEYIDSLSFWDRWLFPLMAVDVGAKAAYVEPDKTTINFAQSVGVTDYEIVTDDAGAQYAVDWRWDVSDLEPQICFPPTVGNVAPIRQYVGTPVQWAELGGHGGGRLPDIEMAARVMKQRPKHERVNFNLVPGSRYVFAEAVKSGDAALLHERGGTWFPASTGSNQAVNMGAMAAGETMISTHVRNFPGRNGSPKAHMFLASALTVAASATAGKIVDPREFI
jgi:3-isopropylmalate/(R)-2-methylmalate dehydratase large subunit